MMICLSFYRPIVFLFLKACEITIFLYESQQAKTFLILNNILL